MVGFSLVVVILALRVGCCGLFEAVWFVDFNNYVVDFGFWAWLVGWFTLFGVILLWCVSWICVAVLGSLFVRVLWCEASGWVYGCWGGWLWVCVCLLI